MKRRRPLGKRLRADTLNVGVVEKLENMLALQHPPTNPMNIVELQWVDILSSVVPSLIGGLVLLMLTWLKSDLGKRTDDLGKRIDDLGKRIDDVHKRIDDVNKAVDRVDLHLQAHEASCQPFREKTRERLVALETKLDIPNAQG